MRQLVSVVTDSSIMFLVHDDDETTQIAQVTNTGLDIASVVRLGINLDEALHLNGRRHASHAVSKREPAALPPASTSRTKTKTTPKSARAKGYKLRVDDSVRCEVCSKIMRRGSLSDHGMRVHDWPKEIALRARRLAPAVDEQRPQRSESGAQRTSAADERSAAERRATDGRRVVQRRPVADTWPNATPSAIFELLQRHPDGLSTREIAQMLTDTSGRGRQTIGNKLQTLRAQGVIVTSEEQRPHFKTGKPFPTMVVRAVTVTT